MADSNVMSPNAAIVPTDPAAALALLTDRLASLEASLLETRGRVLHALDRELSSLRDWMSALEESTGDTERVVEPVEKDSTLADLMEQPPMASNIVPFTSADFFPKIGKVKDASPNLALERATVEELNAALAAAFQRVVKY